MGRKLRNADCVRHRRISHKTLKNSKCGIEDFKEDGSSYAVIPECFCRESIVFLLAGFPPILRPFDKLRAQDCGNDSMVCLPCFDVELRELFKRADEAEERRGGFNSFRAGVAVGAVRPYFLRACFEMKVPRDAV